MEKLLEKRISWEMRDKLWERKRESKERQAILSSYEACKAFLHAVREFFLGKPSTSFVFQAEVGHIALETSLIGLPMSSNMYANYGRVNSDSVQELEALFHCRQSI